MYFNLDTPESDGNGGGEDDGDDGDGVRLQFSERDCRSGGKQFSRIDVANNIVRPFRRLCGAGARASTLIGASITRIREGGGWEVMDGGEE